MTRFVHGLALIVIPLWWMFHLLWNPSFVDVVSALAYKANPPQVAQSALTEAKSRALKIAMLGTTDVRDVVFTPNEVAHLNDVSTLYKPIARVLNFLSACAWIVLLAFVLKKKSFVKSFQDSAFVYAGFVVLFFGFLLFFSIFFTQFHTILFPQGNWEFPADSLLIQTFPELFWKLMVGLLLLLCAGVAGVYALLSLVGRQSADNDESSR